MKRFLIILITFLIFITTLVLYYKGVAVVDEKVAIQITGINSQITEFENRYNNVKEIGNSYLDDIIQTCMTNKPTENFKSIYIRQEATHDGGELDFCYALDNSIFWDDYQLYCIDYASAHDIKIQDIYTKIKDFDSVYSSYDKQSEEWAILMDTLPFYDNYYTFKFYNYTVEKVTYFATMYNDYITQLIEIKGINDNVMTIEVLWFDGKIKHVVRRM